MSSLGQWNVFAAGKDLVTTMLFIPFCHGRVLMHMLNYVAPANAGIVGAETNLTFLSSVRNDAHLRPPEVVIE